MKLHCVVERITYQNPDNGYTVLKTSVPGYTDLIPVVGNMPDVNAGCVLDICGEWKNDSKYGQQFMAKSWTEVMPATLYGIEKYLGSGMIKGIGPVYSKRIVSAFGMNTLDIIEKSPDKLLSVKGIGERKVESIKESWAQQKEIRNIVMFLQQHGVNTSHAARIFKTYRNDSIDIIKENPYRLADDIWGIGFKTADSIAEKLGYAKNGYPRCRSGIMYTLNQLSDQGHTYALREQLITAAIQLLEVSESPITTAIDQMIQDEDLIQDDDAIYLPLFYYAEQGVANRLLALSSAKPRIAPSQPPDIQSIEKTTGVTYDDIQADAIRQAVTSKVSVLTGGPGTGKTTTTLGIIKVLQSCKMKILLAAPTGRAAKRMTEATGMEAKTIHRLLEFSPDGGYKHNNDNPLEGDVLIVDEASMIDILLMNSLVKAIPPHMRLILVGDIDQLPSVGAGNVLRDIIDSGVFPVVRLTRIFRQAQTSRIIMNAHKVNHGELPDISNGKDTDFFFIREDEPEKIAETMLELVQTRLPRTYHVNPRDIQVLTPMQKGVVGAANLNTVLQAAINRNPDGIRRGTKFFKLGDKVMQIRNNYEKNVFNGDIGVVDDIDMTELEMTVDYDGNLVEYEFGELDELVLAYATTIHKSQGSEYPIVVMPVSMSHFIMLQRNLVYTGITRAKKLCVLVGSKRALAYAVNNVTVLERNTRLKERLMGT